MVMSEYDQIVGLSTQVAKALGKYQGFTRFLAQDNNTMTKEQIVACLVEINDSFEASIRKPKTK